MNSESWMCRREARTRRGSLRPASKKNFPYGSVRFLSFSELQEAELVVVVELDRVQNARGDVHDRALARPSDEDGEARASVVDREPIVGLDLVCDVHATEARGGRDR